MTKASQRHLWDGKVITSKHTVSFSEKKTRVPMRPNLTIRLFYSEILERNIRVQISVSLLRKIRYFGNFDNYILLSRPQTMWSTFGEYLRLLMLRRLRDPSFDVKNKHVFGCEKKCNIKYKDIPYYKGIEHFPTALKTVDLSRFRPNYLENYTRRQMKVLKAFFKGPDEFKKVEDEVQRIHLKEHELEQEFLEQEADLREKHQKAINRFKLTQPKRYKLMHRMQGDADPNYIDPNVYPGKDVLKTNVEDEDLSVEDDETQEVF